MAGGFKNGIWYQVRDYLDVAALCGRFGVPHAAQVLRGIDDCYSDQRRPADEGVATCRSVAVEMTR